MSERDGGPAFPFRMTEGTSFRDSRLGLTKREWYAGMALAAIRPRIVQHVNRHEYLTPEALELKLADTVAKGAYEIADAMLRAGREGGDDA